MIRVIQTTALSALILLFCVAQTLPARAQNAAPGEAGMVVEKSKSDSASKPSTSPTSSTSSTKSTKPADSAEELAYTDTFGKTATEYKLYAPGVGLVLDGDLVLSRYGVDIKVPAAAGDKE